MNPYTELTRPEQEAHLIELDAEWLDICHRQSELNLEAKEKV